MNFLGALRGVANVSWRQSPVHQSFRFDPQSLIRYRRLSSSALAKYTETSLSSSEAAPTTAILLDSSLASTTSVTEKLTATVIRHGPGDGVITLNVGGTEFRTLRSTIYSNPVLKEYVLRAEKNQAFIHEGAIFVDRDPTHFSKILQHLRNTADHINYYQQPQDPGVFPFMDLFFWRTQRHSISQVLIDIPKDKGELRDLFVEAQHYKIQELVDDLCQYDTFTQLAYLFSRPNGTNPFYAASQFAMAARRTLLATGGIGVFFGSQNGEWMDDVAEFISELKLWLRGESIDERKQSSPSGPSWS